GRIPGFNNNWNQTKMQVIAKEDQMRWDSQDKMQEMRNITGEQRRAHSCLGPFPGCRRLAPLSPRKSAAINFLEQKLCRSDSMPSMPTAHDRLYDGVSKEEQGRKAYLKQRNRTSLQH
ncbi:unnamed protein product, partial [Polarella glacialis]